MSPKLDLQTIMTVRCGYWEANSGPLQDQGVLLTTEHAL